MKLSSRASLALFIATFFWGATFVVVKEALNHSSALLFIAVRFTIATLIVATLMRQRLKPDSRWADSARCGVLAGACLFLGYAFQTIGLRYTTPTKSAFVTSLLVVMVPLLGAILYRSVPVAAEWVGVLLSVTGLGLLTLRGEDLRPAAGDVITFGCTIAYAGHILVVGRFAGRTRFEQVAVIQLGVCAALAWLAFPVVEEPFFRSSPILWFAILVTAVFTTAFGFTVQAWAQQHTTPTRTALIFVCEPLFAWLTSYLMTGEVLDPRGVAGAALILAGILLVEMKPFRTMGHLSP
ncbi:MAG: DMT family transporter [Bryobacteraceae bacterium]